mgnify:CR=1 FL=1
MFSLALFFTLLFFKLTNLEYIIINDIIIAFNTNIIELACTSIRNIEFAYKELCEKKSKSLLITVSRIIKKNK